MSDIPVDNITEIIGSGPENIKVIRNFMPPEHCHEIYNFYKSLPERKDVVHNYSLDNRLINENDKIKRLEILYKKKYIDTVKDMYGLELDEKDRDFLDFFVHPVGTHIDPHTDVIGYDQYEFNPEDVFVKQVDRFPYLWSGHVSVLVYINDDYEGGELYFPRHNLTIIPEQGMLVCFPGNLFYQHEVKEVQGTTRYAVSLWTKFKDFKNVL